MKHTCSRKISTTVYRHMIPPRVFYTSRTVMVCDVSAQWRKSERARRPSGIGHGASNLHRWRANEATAMPPACPQLGYGLKCPGTVPHLVDVEKAFGVVSETPTHDHHSTLNLPISKGGILCEALLLRPSDPMCMLLCCCCLDTFKTIPVSLSSTSFCLNLGTIPNARRG